jgi:hypothetical protein
MPLVRQISPSSKPERIPHKCVPIHGEFGRYTVDSASAAKKGKEEAYIVDVLIEEETNAGTIVGTCPCKGWSVRKTCTHLVDAKAEHERLQIEKLGFDKLD